MASRDAQMRNLRDQIRRHERRASDLNAELRTAERTRQNTRLTDAERYQARDTMRAIRRELNEIRDDIARWARRLAELERER